jgi:hypothetical protein
MKRASARAASLAVDPETARRTAMSVRMQWSNPDVRTLRHRRAAAPVTALLVAVAISACGGGSESSSNTASGSATTSGQADQQDKAQQQVCSARAAIQTEITTLQGLPVTAASIVPATQSLKKIQTSLQTVVDAQDKLSPERKQQVQTATKSFTGEVEAAAGDIASKSASGDAKDAVRAAADNLAASYKKAFAPVDCS